MKRQRLARIAVCAALTARAAYAGSHDVGENAKPLPPHVVADSTAPLVSEANLLSSERFWPYQVELTEPFVAGRGGMKIPAGTSGILIRVEASGASRVDFGRDGLVTVPVKSTDLLQRANAIRTGAVKKTAPNLTYAIAPRLIDADSELGAPLPFEKSIDRPGYLCFFADPLAASFAGFARLIAPLSNRGDVLPVLFAQGRESATHEQLRAAGWRGAYVVDHLAAPYTRTLIDGEVTAPTLALYTAEGRLLWQGELTGALPPELVRALAEAFPAKS
jgi:hypothetical protein